MARTAAQIEHAAARGRGKLAGQCPQIGATRVRLTDEIGGSCRAECIGNLFAVFHCGNSFEE
jgi:hypothetical protein